MSSILEHHNIPTNLPVFGLKYRVLKILLLFTGLRFRRYDSKEQFRGEMILRFILALSYIGLVAYILLKFLLVAMFIPTSLDNRGDVLRSYALIIWIFLILVTMSLIFYWELRGYNRLVLEDALQYEATIDEQFHADWPTRVFLSGLSLMFFLRAGDILIGALANPKYNTMQRLFVYEILELPFGKGFGVVLTSIIVIHVFFVLFIILLFYALPSFVIRYRLLYLKLELQKLGEQREKQLISEFYHNYRQLMQSVSAVNERFQIYRIITTLLCVVILAATSYAFSVTSNHKWLDYMYLIIEAVSIIIILMSLIYPASSVKSTLNSVKLILYYNTQLWFPYDQQVYELTKLYAEMAELVSNEISIWGTQYAKKPFFVTIGSIGFIGLAASKFITLPSNIQ